MELNRIAIVLSRYQSWMFPYGVTDMRRCTPPKNKENESQEPPDWNMLCGTVILGVVGGLTVYRWKRAVWSVF